ncbi:HIT domain-containing protein [Methylolobus aquaticus]|nr:HIT domain-containing protein [Methylolobus aquaticus]
MNDFTLHPRLAGDCLTLGTLPLCRVLLMNDRTYPWLILVPQRNGIAEICELSEADQHVLIAESSRVAQAMLTLFKPDKLNIAAIGNLVPQLHVHHVARFRSDPAWPGTVWGRERGEPYPAEQVGELLQAFLRHLPDLQASV